MDIRVPQLGESVLEATVSRILKQVGEMVREDETVVELETDKVNVEVPAGSAGVMQQILAKEGDTVSINDLLAVVTASGNGTAPAANGSAAAKADVAPVPVADAAVAPATPAEAAPKTAASPVAESIAKVEGVDIAQVAGSGPNGKVVKQDVASYLQQSPAKSAEAAPAVAPTSAPKLETAPTPTPAAVVSAGSPVLPYASPQDDKRVERLPMSRRRQAIATGLKTAQNTAAMLTTFNEADMSAVMALRKKRAESFEKNFKVKLGFMSFFTKAAIGALKAFPNLNAEISPDGKEILLKHYYDIGIAVGVPEGLVVPVVRNADKLTFADIEKQIGELAGRARENKLSLADMQNGSFTITNGGVFGSLMSTPILNYPQVGILGLHKIQERPVVVAGEIVIRPMMYLALSYDHRIVDGGEAVRFLVKLKELIEDPESLLLEA